MSLSWASLKRRPVHTLMTGATILLASAVLFFSLAAGAGLSSGLSVGIERMGADLIVLPEKARSDFEEQMLFSGAPINVYMDKKVGRRVAKTAGVRRSTPQLFVQTLNKACCNLKGATRLVGIDDSSDFVIKPWLDSHGLNSLGGNKIVVGSQIPAFLGNQAVILKKKFEVAGRLDPSGGGMDQTVFISLTTARKLAGTVPDVRKLIGDKIPPENLISAVMVQIEDDSEVDKVAENIAKIDGLRVIAPSKFMKSTGAYISLLQKVLLSLSGLLLLVSLLAVAGRFMAMVFERRSQIGVFRALGARKTDIFVLFTMESLILTTIGSVLGVMFGYIFVDLSSKMLSDLAILPFLAPTVAQYAVYSGLTIFATLAAGVVAISYPAYLCSRQDPATAIARGELE